MSDLISRQAAIDTHCELCGDRDKCNGDICPDVEVFQLLPSTQPEQRWIPCSERLPEEYGMYLVTMMEKAKAEDFGFDVDDIEVRKMRYNNGWQLPRHIPAWINNVITDEVIAWMPLPEPYGGEQE